jgi:hypothetical protein
MYATEAQAALLRAAVEEIKKHPETFDMRDWACGTTCCLAGQIVRNSCSSATWRGILAIERLKYLNGPIKFPVLERAMRLLGIAGHSDDIVGHDDRLFYTENWPSQFQPELDDNGIHVNPSLEQLEARVEHWIQTGE